jgi:hypothetical protein
MNWCAGKDQSGDKRAFLLSCLSPPAAIGNARLANRSRSSKRGAEMGWAIALT